MSAQWIIKGLDPVGVEKHGCNSHTFLHTDIHANTDTHQAMHMHMHIFSSMSETHEH